MKNLYKVLFGFVFAAVAFSSCNVEKINATYVPEDNIGVSFMSKVAYNDEIDPSETVFNIPVVRSIADGPLTVDITGSITGLSIPSSITFNAGEYQAFIPVTLAGMVAGTTYTGNIAIVDEKLSDKNVSITKCSVSLSLKLSWTKIATGDYTYSIFWEGVDPGLDLYRADGTDYYKISNWGGGVDFCFFMYPDNTGLVPDQLIGYNHSSYGQVSVRDEEIKWPGDPTNDPTYYDPATKTYYFGVQYYVSAGSFGYGHETFQLK